MLVGERGMCRRCGLPVVVAIGAGTGRDELFSPHPEGELRLVGEGLGTRAVHVGRGWSGERFRIHRRVCERAAA